MLKYNCSHSALWDSSVDVPFVKRAPVSAVFEDMRQEAARLFII